MFYKFCRGVLRPFYYIFIGRTNIKGAENLVSLNEGPAIVCANHISNWDPFIVAFAVKRQIFFMAKKALFENPVMNKIMRAGGAIPVEREGNDITAVRQAFKVLKSGEILGIFPEGKRYRDGTVHEFKEGLPLIAHKMKVKILPIGIKGRPGLFKRAEIEIGAPIDFNEYFSQKGNSDIYKEMNNIVHKEISRLAFGKDE